MPSPPHNMGHHDTLPSAIRHAMHYAAAAIDCCSARKVKPRNEQDTTTLKNIYASKHSTARIVAQAWTATHTSNALGEVSKLKDQFEGQKKLLEETIRDAKVLEGQFAEATPILFFVL